MTDSSCSHAAIGVDFGTTNSSVARAHGASARHGALAENRSVALARFPMRLPRVGSSAPELSETASFRSLLYLEQSREQLRQNGRTSAHSWAGPAAIEHYLDRAQFGETESSGRLIQSLKSYLPSRSLTGAEIFGRRYLLEDLIARILRDLREQAERSFGAPITTATVGRPVRFVGAENADDEAYALSRLSRAFELAGFESVRFEMEPIAAAYAYESTLDHDELILIGDFGGGTSDFSLLRVGPGVRARGRMPSDLLGTSGVPLAGDAFDAKLVRKLVSPALGAESLSRSLGKLLPAVPTWIYANLERWHYLSFLRTRNVLEILNGARARALEPEKIEALLTLIEEDLGYQLHQAVQRVKFELSHSETAEFAFKDGSMEMRIPVSREEFEGWIGEELEAIEISVDTLIASAGVSARDVDRVFLTGGTSFVPAVRRIFTSRFGQDRVLTGEAFTSVAYGLALQALDTI